MAFSLGIATTGSHVPHKSLMQVGATYMPDAMRPGNRFSSALVLEPLLFPNFDIACDSFRHFISGSLTLVSLHRT